MRTRIKPIIEISAPHVAAAIMTSIALLFTFQQFINFSHRPNEFFLGLVYFTDYHENARYPIVREGLRSKVHGNGIVTHAYPEARWKLRIKIEKVQSFPANLSGSAPTIYINPLGPVIN